MGEKDISEKILESYNDVFADIVNVLLFNGKQIIHPNELEDHSPRSAYKADGKIREMERDVSKHWKRDNIRIACVGLENQTEADPDMPLRVFGYDGSEYRSQLTKANHNKPRYPVVTIVLYFGYKKHWDKPTTLHEALQVSDMFKPYVSDIKINLFEIAWLNRETVEKFKSDFRMVADYFVQMRENGDYTPRPDELLHVQETMQLLRVMADDYRFEEILNDTSEKGAVKNMCDVLDRAEMRGEKRGIQQGMQQGMQQGIQQGMQQGMNKANRDALLALMKNLNFSPLQAMDALNIPEADRSLYSDLLKQ